MARKHLTSVELTDGRRVGYGLFRRGRVWYVRFRDLAGKWVKIGLGVENKSEAVRLAEVHVRLVHSEFEF
jgi:hypothetical protein